MQNGFEPWNAPPDDTKNIWRDKKKAPKQAVPEQLTEQSYPGQMQDNMNPQPPYGQPAPDNQGLYQETEQNLPPKVEPEKPKVKRQIRKKSALILGIAGLVFVGLLLILFDSTVMRLRSVTVNGLVNMSAREVAAIADILPGQRYRLVNADKVRERVEADGKIAFISLEKHFPDTVVLNVKERQKRANLVVMGIMYVLDEEGMVLEKSTGVNSDNGLITVTGMQIKQGRQGNLIVASKSTQLSAYSALLEELTKQNVLSLFSEMNLAELGHVYLISRDGYTVDIGSPFSDLRAKIGTARAVINELRNMGKTGGLIDATVPGEATYSPQAR